MRPRTPTWLVVLAVAVSRGVALPERSEPPEKHVFRLQHCADGFRHFVHFVHRDSPAGLNGKPGSGGRPAFLGVLPVSADGEACVGVAWDRRRARLYVDLNQDSDLTGDPAEVFEAERADWQQYFEGIQVTVGQGSMRRKYLMDFFLYTYDRGRCSGHAIVRSGWQGTVELHGKEFVFAVVDNLRGTIDSGDLLILARAEAAPDGLAAQIGPYRFSFLKRFHVDSRTYESELSFEPGDAGAEVVAALTQVEVPMGRVEITGQFIDQVTLAQGKDQIDLLVVLDRPRHVSQVPVGEYKITRVTVDGGESGGLFQAFPYESLSIASDQVASVALGGPLKQRVTHHRNGNTLQLSYALRGVGGERYVSVVRKEPPRFTVRNLGIRLTSGQFEYG